MNKTALCSRQVSDVATAFRVGKLFATFEKRDPGMDRAIFILHRVSIYQFAIKLCLSRRLYYNSLLKITFKMVVIQCNPLQYVAVTFQTHCGPIIERRIQLSTLNIYYIIKRFLFLYCACNHHCLQKIHKTGGCFFTMCCTEQTQSFREFSRNAIVEPNDTELLSLK